MTPDVKADLALAILLWKGFKLDLTQSGGCPTEASERAAYRSIELAKTVGVGEEYLELLFRHPTLDIFCVDLDKPFGGKKKSGKGRYWKKKVTTGG